MGIAPYKTFTFDGESSGDYGVYITGTGVFNAPERSVEMVEIAGRNGSFALDKGKFENIEVKYKVGIVDDSESDFADRVSDFRNWLCSKVGYCRLEDEYNPNEYRMGVYSSGVEIDHDLLIAGEAEITFNCKPQRWLTSGETAVSVADGGTIDNPTLFEASPLLAIDGYGDISFNGYDMSIGDVGIGEIVLYEPRTSNYPNGGYSGSVGRDIEDEAQLLHTGDTITLKGAKSESIVVVGNGYRWKWDKSNSSVSDTNSSFHTLKDNITVQKTSTESNEIHIVTDINKINFVDGTDSTKTNTATASIRCVTDDDDAPVAVWTITITISQSVEYDGTDEIIAIFTSMSVSVSAGSGGHAVRAGYGAFTDEIVGDSTMSVHLFTNYFDCDIGEYWVVVNDKIITLNNIISIGSDLPKLASGTNTFNYDNTITNFTVTPCWWKV